MKYSDFVVDRVVPICLFMVVVLTTALASIGLIKLIMMIWETL